MELYGLNIDFEGPHSLINALLKEAGVGACMVQADARSMPFADGVFGSVSCFLGLQDIRIGFGDSGIREALVEAARVLCYGGFLVLLDEFSYEMFDGFLQGMPLHIQERSECKLDVKWDRMTAEKAIALYAQGYVKQTRARDEEERKTVYNETYNRMKVEMDRQLAKNGYFVPFESVRMVISKKTVL